MNANFSGYGPDPDANTQPVQSYDPLAHLQPMHIPPSRRKPAGWCIIGALGSLGFLVFILFGLVILYISSSFGPFNFLVLGIDRPPQGTNTSRSDTIILGRVDPLKPAISMLSIPRDLWVPIAGVGENRINTAHFFAEANQPGSGPAAALKTVESNFGVQVPYYIRLRFDGFTDVINALGGVTVDLPAPMSGYPAGKTHLDATQALAFVRDRKGADDFSRMGHAPILIKGLMQRVISPLTWPRLPMAFAAAVKAIDTNISPGMWLRIGLTFLRVGANGIDARVLPREMVTSFVTDQGAQVLLPNWALIRPLAASMFTQ
jgi:polyisoprenyl-teichoic acid--peptidoglycan teichoic acid transferase